MKKQYWHNLLLAILGKYPIQPDTDNRVASYQRLVENLRRRIYEKDHLIARLKDRFRQFTHKSDPASAVDQPMT
jgi:hypothetical protein